MSLRIVLLLCAVQFGVVLPSCGHAASPPNFLIFIADDMAWDDCGAYGHPHIQTPNIDALATDGLRFDAAYLTCSSCSPSRASLLTARYPHSTGAHQLHLPLPASQIGFTEPLRAAGYFTAAVGKWHLGAAAKQKFDVVKEGQVPQMVPTLRDRPRDRPFCFWYAFSDPHRPYQPDTIPQPHTAADAVVPPYLPDVPAVRRDLAAYYDEITRLDGVVGAVLRELDAQMAAQNTVVIFMSDNGRPFPRCKTTVYDSGVKTPFIVRWPAVVTPGGSTSSIISSVDVGPTLCELAGVAAPVSFQGVSFARVLADPKVHTRRAAFSEHNWHDYEARERSIRTADYRYIRNDYTDLPGTPPADAVRSPSYEIMQSMQAAGTLCPPQAAVFQTPRPAQELYFLEDDPHELHNLAADPAHADALRDLQAQLERWSRETDDTAPPNRRPDGFDRTTGEPLKKTGERGQ